jgi:hypothetical protein
VQQTPVQQTLVQQTPVEQNPVQQNPVIMHKLTVQAVSLCMITGKFEGITGDQEEVGGIAGVLRGSGGVEGGQLVGGEFQVEGRHCFLVPGDPGRADHRDHLR